MFLFCIGGHPAPCGAYVGYQKVENIWSLVVLVRTKFTVYLVYQCVISVQLILPL